MEYADGGDLYSLIKQYRKEKKNFSEDELWKFAYEILKGIDYLHANNIIHRDIKCLNLFLTKDKRIKIGDLGVSKLVSNINALHCTRVGTPLYLSPELIKQVPYDFKVDIWSVGCSLYHLASLEPPFNGDNLIILGNNIVKTKQKSLPSIYSREFIELVEKLLSKRPDNRPSAKEAINYIPERIKIECDLSSKKSNNIKIEKPIEKIEQIKVFCPDKQNLLFPINKEENLIPNTNFNEKKSTPRPQSKQPSIFNNISSRPVSANINMKNKKENNINPIPIKNIEDDNLKNSDDTNITPRNKENNNLFLKANIKAPNVNKLNPSSKSNSNTNLVTSQSGANVINKPPSTKTIPNVSNINLNINQKIYESNPIKLKNDKKKDNEAPHFIQNVENFGFFSDGNSEKDDEFNNDPVISLDDENKEINKNIQPVQSNNKILIKDNYDADQNKKINRLLSCKVRAANKFRPNTASNNKVLVNAIQNLNSNLNIFNSPSSSNKNFYPQIKSNNNRPYTALIKNKNEENLNEDNKVINININVFNIDVNQRYVNPNPARNLIYINDNLIKKEQVNVLPPFSGRDNGKRPITNRPQTGRVTTNNPVKNKDMNKTEMFDKIIKAIENLNYNHKRQLTINDLK